MDKISPKSNIKDLHYTDEIDNFLNYKNGKIKRF